MEIKSYKADRKVFRKIVHAETQRLIASASDESDGSWVQLKFGMGDRIVSLGLSIAEAEQVRNELIRSIEWAKEQAEAP